jgi:hypothetical protein
MAAKRDKVQIKAAVKRKKRAAYTPVVPDMQARLHPPQCRLHRLPRL